MEGFVSIAEGIRLSGKSKMTVYRMINEGKLSVTVDNTGKKRIQRAELLRVFGELHKTDTSNGNSDESSKNDTVTERPKESNNDTSLIVTVLQEQLEREREQSQRERERADRLEQELTKANDYIRALLPAATSPAEPEKPKSIRQRLFGYRKKPRHLSLGFPCF